MWVRVHRAGNHWIPETNCMEINDHPLFKVIDYSPTLKKALDDLVDFAEQTNLLEPVSDKEYSKS